MDPLESSSWYRVAELRPRLAAEARFHRHRYRGEVWWVVRDPASGRVHRMTPAVRALAEALDGERSIDAAWLGCIERFGDDAPTQDEAIAALATLHGAGLLRGDLPSDTAVLFRRTDDELRKERRGRRNPIAFRVPLVDPQAALDRFAWLARPIFSRTGAWVWLAVLVAGGVSAARHAPELAGAGRSLLEPESLVAFWFVYPIVKFFHELGHAFAVQRWGGEVREMGILFLVFVPVPYVDASAASVFPEKRHRMIVGGAGIAVELFAASLAMLVWAAVEPGAVRHAAYAVMLVGGISTLLFNGNPLLRFDGYHVLADALEIPNLAQRANEYLKILARRRLLGLRDLPLPETAPGEARWLVGYAIAANVYGVSVMLAIALYLASHFFALGVTLALYTVYSRIGRPLVSFVRFLATDAAAGERRGRVLAGSFGSLAAVLVLLFVLPLPLRTRGEGVVWLPEQAHVRAGVDGFVDEVLAEPHARVEAGTRLLRIRDAALEAEVAARRAEREISARRLEAARGADRVEAAIARERLRAAEAALARARERARQVWVQAEVAGVFVPRDRAELRGRRVARGETVAYVVDLAEASARVVVSQEDAGRLRERTRAVTVRLAHDPAQVLPARIERQVPGARDRLPSPALGTAGGGPFAVDPSDPEGLRTLESVFQFDLALPAGAAVAAGERVYARFDHGAEPIGPRAWRSLRRLLLRQLGV